MTKPERPTVIIEDAERKFVHATWSRSGKRVILSVGRSWGDGGQVELTPDQASDLAAFLTASPDDPAR